ncbi:hypothetical protein V6N13_072429 [Hibiscus sabdariffa]
MYISTIGDLRRSLWSPTTTVAECRGIVVEMKSWRGASMKHSCKDSCRLLLQGLQAQGPWVQLGQQAGIGTWQTLEWARFQLWAVWCSI